MSVEIELDKGLNPSAFGVCLQARATDLQAGPFQRVRVSTLLAPRGSSRGTVAGDSRRAPLEESVMQTHTEDWHYL